MGLQLMAGDNQGNVNSYIALVPQDLLHDTLGGFAPRRVDGHANADDIAIAHMGGIASQRENIMFDARVFRNDDAKGLSHFITPHNALMRP